jgi:hypothetical protein
MAGAGKKTFTAGEVLTASDVNTFLMEQSVMYFGGTAARASAIPTPTTGMTSYIGVTGTASIPQIETYTGSAWQTPYGLTQIAKSDFSSVAAIQLDNVFSSIYDNYLCVYKLTSFSGTNVTINLQLVDGTSPISTTNYEFGALGRSFGGATITSDAGSSAFWTLGKSSTVAPDITSGVVNVLAPALANRTAILYNTSNFDGSTSYGLTGYGVFGLTTQVEGLRLSCNSGTFGGNIAVYGYRKS